MTRLALLRSAALTVTAAIGALCLAVAVLCVVFSVRPLVVTSGSMGPTIPAGSVAFAQAEPAADVAVRDVVVVPTHDHGRVMHRVVSKVPTGHRWLLVLKGDANRSADADPYLVDEVHRVRFHVPWLGYPISWLGTPGGLLLLGAAGCVLLAHALRRDPARIRGGRRRAGVAAAMVVPAALAGSTGISTTGAWLTDSAAVTSSAVRTYTVPPTNLYCGELSVASTTFVWDAVPGATSYTLFYQSGSRQTTTTSTFAIVPNLAAGNTAWVVVNRAFGSTTWSSAASNTRTYYVLTVGVCG